MQSQVVMMFAGVMGSWLQIDIVVYYPVPDSQLASAGVKFYCSLPLLHIWKADTN